MKISLPRPDLVTALNTVKSAATNKNSLQILANVHLSAADNQLELTCTDLDILIRTKVDAQVMEKGECTVRAATLLGVISSFAGSATVQLETLTDDLKIIHGDSRYKLGMLEAKEFPPEPKLKDPQEIEFPQHALHSLLAHTAFATSQDEGRYVLCGSLVRLNGSLTTVATDGRRLALEEFALEDNKLTKDILIPARAVKLLLSMLESQEPEEGKEIPMVTLCICENHVQFRIGETTFTSKLIEGAYPQYEAVIPKEPAPPVTIGRTDLLGILKRVDLVSDRCKLDFKGQMLTIRARGRREIPGEAVESLLIAAQGQERSVCFSTAYLIDALEATEADEVLFSVTDAVSPGVITTRNSSWTCIVMPMNAEDKEAAKPAAPPAAAPANAPAAAPAAAAK